MKWLPVRYRSLGAYFFSIVESGEVCRPPGAEAGEGGLLRVPALAPAQGQPEGNTGILRRDEDSCHLIRYRSRQGCQETEGSFFSVPHYLFNLFSSGYSTGSTLRA